MPKRKSTDSTESTITSITMQPEDSVNFTLIIKVSNTECKHIKCHTYNVIAHYKYFEALLCGNSAVTEIELPEKFVSKYNALETFVQLLYNNSTSSIDSDNVHGIAYCANYFDCEFVINDIDDYLHSECENDFESIDVFTALEIAVQYDRDELQDEIEIWLDEHPAALYTAIKQYYNNNNLIY